MWKVWGILAGLSVATGVQAATPGQDLLLFGSSPFYPGATVDMNFVTGQYKGLTPSGLTVSRASSESEFCNGVVTTVGANVPAITPGCGLWSWEARTNSITYSQSLNQAGYWSGAGAGSAAPTYTGGQAAPDGSTNAAKLAFPAVSGTNFASIYLASTVAMSSQQVWSQGLYMKGAVGGETVWLELTPDAVTFYEYKAVLTTSWKNYAGSFLISSNMTPYYAVGVDLRDTQQTAQGAQTIYIWNPQLELNPNATTAAQGFPTGPILTSGSAATRAAPTITASENFSTAYSMSCSAQFAEPIYNGQNYQNCSSLYQNMNNRVAPLSRSVGGTFYGVAYFVAGTSYGITPGPVIPANTLTKAAGSWSSASSNYSYNGTLYSGTAVTPPTMNTLIIGADVGPSLYANGVISRISLWPYALSTSQLNYVTTH